MTELDQEKDFQINSYGWNPDSGYIKGKGMNDNSGLELYLKYAASDKHDLILQLMTKENSDSMEDDPSCRGSSGFKILIHDPATIPQSITSKVISASSDTETTITITPTLVTVSNDVSLIHPDKYSCRRWDEQNLDYFNLYTKENCILECFVKYTLDFCRCVAYYMPRKNNTQICTSENKWCLSSSYRKFFYNSELYNSCNCLPACHQILYEVSATNEYYSWAKYQKVHNYKSMSKIRIHYSDFHLTWYKYFLDNNNTLTVINLFAVINLIVLIIFILLIAFLASM